MMKTLPIAALILATAGAGCSKRVDVEKVPVGTTVDVTREDGGVVRGALAQRDDKTVTLTAGSATRAVPRDQIADVQVVADTPAPLPAIARFREYTLPEGTTLSVRLESAVGSDSARVGDPVEAILTDAVVAEGNGRAPRGQRRQGRGRGGPLRRAREEPRQPGAPVQLDRRCGARRAVPDRRPRVLAGTDHE